MSTNRSSAGSSRLAGPLGKDYLAGGGKADSLPQGLDTRAVAWLSGFLDELEGVCLEHPEVRARIAGVFRNHGGGSGSPR